MDLESKCEAAGDESLGQVPLFLTKLFDILSADSWRPIIRWSEDGRSFVVADVINFERQVLPLYWGHGSLPPLAVLTSFPVPAARSSRRARGPQY